MTRHANTLVLPLARRAELYRGLYRQLDSGLDAVQSIRGVGGPASGRAEATLARTGRAVAKGVTLAEAGLRAGLWSAADHRLIAEGELAGALARVLGRLADSYERRAALARQVRGRVMMPAFVLAVGLFAAPLPALVGGRMDVGSYLLVSIGPLVAIAATVWLISRSARTWTTRGLPAPVQTLVNAVRPLRAVVLAHDRARALDVLAMLLAAGLPAAEALAALCDGVLDRRLRQGLARATRAVANGAALAEQLREAELLASMQDYAIVSTGEAAGRLDESIGRVALAAGEGLATSYDLAAEWAPRIVYLVVVAIVAKGIFAG